MRRVLLIVTLAALPVSAYGGRLTVPGDHRDSFQSVHVAQMDPDVAAQGATVWGVVYRCSHSALNNMDTHEGVAGGHYARKQVRVRVDGGDELDAASYVAGNAFIDNSLAPSPEYL